MRSSHPLHCIRTTCFPWFSMASTYPLEVVQADRWVKENKNLKGDEQKAEAASRAGTTTSSHWWRRRMSFR